MKGRLWLSLILSAFSKLTDFFFGVVGFITADTYNVMFGKNTLFRPNWKNLCPICWKFHVHTILQICVAGMHANCFQRKLGIWCEEFTTSSVEILTWKWNSQSSNSLFMQLNTAFYHQAKRYGFKKKPTIEFLSREKPLYYIFRKNQRGIQLQLIPLFAQC